MGKTNGRGGGTQWAARPWVARIIKTVAFIAPIVLSVLISLAISRAVDPPSTRLGQIGWWIVLSAIATAVLFVFDKISRRLLPLSALFGLSLIFPDQAPSRFRTALRTGTVAQLRRRIEDAKANGIGDDPAEAARTLVELAGALSVHDRLTRGHSERVRAYTKLIAEELKLPDDEVDRLQWAGLAHDVGKLFVDPEILNKPGRLTDDEYEAIKAHTIRGAELVSPLRVWLGDALDAVDEHHERWDGKGYPKGLAGTEIGLPGRIVAVADVFDVITSVRSYKAAQGVTEAREELVRCSGTQFDPRVVRAFMNIGLGRLRLLVGPLSWLAQLPVVGRAPVGAAAAPAIAALGTSFSLLFGGFFGTDALEPPIRAEVVALAAPTSTTVATAPLPTTTTTTSTSAPATTIAPTSTTAPITTTAPTTITTTTTTTTITTSTLPPTTAPRSTARIRDDRVTATEDTSIEIDVLANDEGPDGTVLRITAVSVDTRGTVSTDGSTIAFAPEPDQHGTATITYTVVDALGLVHTGNVTITITPVNDDPVAADDSIRTNEDTAVPVAVLANDSDVDGDVLALSSVRGESLGTATIIGNRLWYVPSPDVNGIDTMTYSVSDGHGGTASASVSVTITPVNDAPTIVPGPAPTVAEDAGPQSLDGWATGITPGGGADESGQSLRAIVTATNASLFSARPALDPSTGTLTFAAAPNAAGTSTVTVVLDDGFDATTVTFTLRVTAVNDAPVANDDTLTLTEDDPATTATVLANDTDIDGDTLTITSVTGATLGTATTDGTTITYTPDPNANGTDTLTTTIDDGNGATDTATLTITIAPVNDAPVANDDAATLTEDDPATTITVLANDTDIDGDTLAVTAVTGAALGTATTDGTTITYTPDPNVNGTDTLTTTIDDGNGSTDTATLTITITAVEDAPTITLGADPTTPEDDGPETLVGWATAITPGGGPDEAGQPLTATLAATTPALFSVQPALDLATGDLTYTAAPDVNGSTSVTIDLDDGTNTTTSTFTITIAPVNDAPVANDDAATLTEDDPATTITVLANDTDIDGDTLAVTAVTGAALGTATTDGTTITYTPDPNVNGTDTLTTTIDDGNGATDTATLTITITAVNDSPMATDESYATSEGVDLVVAAPGVLANDADLDGDTLTVITTPAVPPTNGTVTLAADGSFTYSTTSPTFSGTDSFTYTLSDGVGGTATANVEILVEDGLAPSRYYLGSTGPSADTFTLNPAPGPPAPTEPDYADDVDTSPGFTIKDGNDSLSETDPTKYQHWTLGTSTPLAFRGPVSLDLWSTTAGFDEDQDMDYSIWLHDCAVDGSDCQLLTSVVSVHADEWNGGAATWSNRVLPAGSIDHTLVPGRVLRLRLMFDHTDAWIALSGTRPSALDLTLANASPDAIDDSASVLEDAATTTLAVLTNDVDLNLDPATVTITGPSTKGTAVARGDGQVDYTPDPDLNGADSFTYQVCDTGGLCDIATVAVTITPVNDEPTFQPGGPASATEDDGTTNVDDWATAIVAGPTDELATQTVWFDVTNDNPALFVDQPTIEPDGKLTFKGAADAFGSANVTVVMRDDGGTADGGVDASAPAVFVITITPVQDAPTAVDDVAVADEDLFVNIAVKQNDVDPDGDVLTIDSFTQGSDGTITANGDGTLHYTPDPGFFGTDSFDYVITDGFGGFDTARVDITVNATPLANPDTYVLLLGGGTLDVTNNDVDDDPLSIGQVDTTVTTGTVVCGITDCTYTPAGIGPDSFRYRLRDPRGVWSNWVTVSILITL